MKKVDTEQTMTIRFLNSDGTHDVWIYDTSRRPFRVIDVTLNVRIKHGTSSQHKKSE